MCCTHRDPLTPERIIEKSVVPLPVKKLSDIYGILGFVVIFTTAVY
jgi:hypothetical protein